MHEGGTYHGDLGGTNHNSKPTGLIIHVIHACQMLRSQLVKGDPGEETGEEDDEMIGPLVGGLGAYYPFMIEFMFSFY